MLGKKPRDKQQTNVTEIVPDIIPRAPGDLKVLGRLEPVEYWEWRTTIEELMHAVTKVSVATANIRIKELETALVRRDGAEVKRQSGLVKAEYERLKLKLERKHNLSLNETVISPENFEIRELKHKDE